MPTVARRLWPANIPISASAFALLLGHQRHHHLKRTNAEIRGYQNHSWTTRWVCYNLSSRVFVVCFPRGFYAAAMHGVAGWSCWHGPVATPHEKRRKDNTNRLVLCSRALLHCDCRPFFRARRPRGSTIALRVAPFLWIIVGSPLNSGIKPSQR